MWGAIFGFADKLLAIVLKLFGIGEAKSAQNAAYKEAVIKEALKYEKGVDNASNVREENKKLDSQLKEEWEKKWNPKPPTPPANGG